jgi:hypothetical protein
VLPLPRSPYFGPPAQQPESVQRLRCVVANPTGDFRITLVDLDIEWTPAADASATMRRGYLKTASIEPQGSAAFLAWFPTELREARCILRGVRGQPAD